MWLVYPSDLSRLAFDLCKQIVHNRKCIHANTFEGYWSRDATVLHTREYEETVIDAANTLIERASHG